ncbi:MULTISPECIES: Solitary outer membrane autotransporter beta-barrel domain [unclassified Agarivorans]|uniref:Solitary outer membrane autotransporter beta-barrel domain n=1 Tax=unclassified Agarivorans TaxID=2636026 RepID=UPI0026E23CD0|nr:MULTISPECIES: Solitary outer membrane autotransporter beta-barrel domain [unclassified Agarivorans]MDO6685514.1 Solitary outer membrane autotransporter beta-barrel domain [Agarivorans sp. 3_MG-2023]MDO6715900.1 Solitary outer membrane autotransporter beta-barrel domain [Agarivorans sp. 2_MG-2023]
MLAKRCSPFILIGFCLPFMAQAALVKGHLENEILPILERNLSGTFAADAIIHDRETVTIGFVNFDPSGFIPIDDDNLGGDDANRLKNELKTITLPLTLSLPWHGSGWETYTTGRLGYTQRFHDVALFEEIDSTRDHEKLQVYSAYLGGGLHLDPWSNWRLSAELGGSLRRLNQSYTYNNSISQIFQPVFDGVLTNFSLNAWMLHPSIALQYQRRWTNHKLKYRSRFEYLRGESFGSDVASHQVQIAATSWRNTLYYAHPIGRALDISFAGQLSASRVDLTGNTNEAFQTPHYYEFGFDLLMGTGAYGEGWLDNVSIGLLFNYGSVLKGGSLVFNYNTY